MSSNDLFLAEIASMLERARSRVTRVTGVTDGAAAYGVAGVRRGVPPVSSDADVPDSHTVTPVTRLHRQDVDDEGALLERAAIIEHDGGLPREIANGLALLDGMLPPSGYSDAQWSDTVAAMAAFADQFWRQSHQTRLDDGRLVWAKSPRTSGAL